MYLRLLAGRAQGKSRCMKDFPSSKWLLHIVCTWHAHMQAINKYIYMHMNCFLNAQHTHTHTHTHHKHTYTHIHTHIYNIYKLDMNSKMLSNHTHLHAPHRVTNSSPLVKEVLIAIKKNVTSSVVIVKRGTWADGRGNNKGLDVSQGLTLHMR